MHSDAKVEFNCFKLKSSLKTDFAKVDIKMVSICDFFCLLTENDHKKGGVV